MRELARRQDALNREQQELAKNREGMQRRGAEASAREADARADRAAAAGGGACAEAPAGTAAAGTGSARTAGAAGRPGWTRRSGWPGRSEQASRDMQQASEEMQQAANELRRQDTQRAAERRQPRARAAARSRAADAERAARRSPPRARRNAARVAPAGRRAAAARGRLAAWPRQRRRCVAPPCRGAGASGRTNGAAGAIDPAGGERGQPSRTAGSKDSRHKGSRTRPAVSQQGHAKVRASATPSAKRRASWTGSICPSACGTLRAPSGSRRRRPRRPGKAGRPAVANRLAESALLRGQSGSRDRVSRRNRGNQGQARANKARRVRVERRTAGERAGRAGDRPRARSAGGAARRGQRPGR